VNGGYKGKGGGELMLARLSRGRRENKTGAERRQMKGGYKKGVLASRGGWREGRRE